MTLTLTLLEWILYAFFVGIATYFLGVRRGIKTHKGDYDQGYADASDACIDHSDYYEAYSEGRDAMMDFVRENYVLVPKDADRYREEAMRDMLDQVEELFEDEEETILDGGEY